MNRILASLIVSASTIAPALAAETTERTQSILDANPACMERNAPDCVLRSEFVSPSATAPQGMAVVPTPALPVIIAPGTPAVMAPTPSTPRPIIIAPRP